MYRCLWKGCNYQNTFTTERELYRHLIYTHSARGRQNCLWMLSKERVCMRNMSDRSQMKDHAITHFGISFRSIVCDECGMTFRNRQDGARHIKSAHGDMVENAERGGLSKPKLVNMALEDESDLSSSTTSTEGAELDSTHVMHDTRARHTSLCYHHHSEVTFSNHDRVLENDDKGCTNLEISKIGPSPIFVSRFVGILYQNQVLNILEWELLVERLSDVESRNQRINPSSLYAMYRHWSSRKKNSRKSFCEGLVEWNNHYFSSLFQEFSILKPGQMFRRTCFFDSKDKECKQPKIQFCLKSFLKYFWGQWKERIDDSGVAQFMHVVASPGENGKEARTCEWTILLVTNARSNTRSLLSFTSMASALAIFTAAVNGILPTTYHVTEWTIRASSMRVSAKEIVVGATVIFDRDAPVFKIPLDAFYNTLKERMVDSGFPLNTD